MTDHTDLCKRLRGPDGRAEPLCGDAADALEALQAEVAHHKDVLESYIGTYTREKERAERAEAENAGLILENEALHDVHDLLLAANARAEKAEAENADMKSRWMDWCDSHALDRIEALQAELDRVMQAAANGGYCRRTHYQAGGTV